MKLAEYRAGMRTFSARDGRQLSYEVRGSGPLMVMIPGGPGMDPQAYYAAADIKGFRQVIFCPRGTCLSDAPSDPTTYRVADHVGDLEDLRAYLGADR